MNWPKCDEDISSDDKHCKGVMVPLSEPSIMFYKWVCIVCGRAGAQ